MSWSALAWAGKQRPGRASDKLVLFALADRHNEETDLAYPSIAWLADFCDLDRKTVIASLARLEALSLIADSGERTGHTKQIKAYRLAIGTVPQTEPSQKRNSSEKSRKQYQKRDTEPVLNLKPLVSSNDDTSPKPLTIEEVVEDWNEMAGSLGLPLVRSITPRRRKAFKARLRECPGLDDWQRAFTCIRNTPWMHGNNDRDWRADFDFLLQAKSFTKLTEEAYGQAQRRVA